ncbi:TPR repeat protein [Imhoffiella purpurea]|uniref:TPR repeat protein n=2 Tax=Imhoffiella purpurea TaxID=1249627 RepID=W9VBT7_9GAMM|nr:TPR repeat protein [Imhoffiella purpurea]
MLPVHRALGAHSERRPAGRCATRRWLSTLLCTGLLLLVAAGEGTAADCAESTARLVSAEGAVSRREGATGPWTAVSPGAGLCEGDTLRTGRNSRAAVRFVAADTQIRLDQSTTLRILPPDSASSDGHLDLIEGAARFFSRVKRRLHIDTPFANALVDGTELLVRVDPERTRVDLFEGSLLVANARGQLRLSAGQGASAGRGEAPRLYRLLDPKDAVQWAISYEPMLSALLWSGRGAGEEAASERLREARRRLLDGDAEAAFAALDRVPPARRDAEFHNLRAALLLSVGRADGARAELAAARRFAPGNPDSDAIESAIALGLDEAERALALARGATESAPERPLPWLALSYAEQARFDLPEARAAMDRALAADPGNGVLRARLAELLLALGELDAAREAADLAADQAPRAALVHRAQGFAALLRIDLGAARAAFGRALDLDPANPVTHLGLGIAQIRSGRLAEGRARIETAVSLDPFQSLLRTYLGKAYLDERRGGRAATALEIATDLDPRDPTPWLYRAIQLRADNRPVEALEALETSYALNDNRAQFRTPGALEADAAARTAAIGQVYRDLEFDQLALVQGFQAVDEAPDDQSGHRLLADVYSALPRHEEARVSELLQAQLLQPLTRTPVLPLQGETRLLITDTLGPSTLGLAEYGPLFERDGASAWVSLWGGGRDSLGDQILATALYDKAAFSVGQYHFETQGSGGMRRQNQDIQVGFAQVQVTPRLGVQAEFRNTDGDEGPYLDETGTDTREHIRSQSARLGLTYRWSPRSVLMASYIHRRYDTDQNTSGIADPADPLSIAMVSGTGSDDGSSAELRQDWRSEGMRLSLGASRFDYAIDLDLDYLGIFGPEESRIRTNIVSDYRIDNTLNSLWLYSTWRPLPRLDLTLGLSWDQMDWDENRLDRSQVELLIPGLGWVELPSDSSQTTGFGASIEQLNPKVGLTWRPFSETTVRAAAFRTLRGPDTLRQTIQPTQVAGFNQLFDGSLGESSWRYGFGIDQSLSARLSVGVEASRRDVLVPKLEPGGADFLEKRHERFVRAYAALTPSERLALLFEYFYEENILRIQDNTEDSTHRVPLTLSYFEPSGIFCSIRGTGVWQSLVPEGAVYRASNSFWTLDLSIGYRLPSRRGLVALSIDNLFDREIPFVETDPNRPLFVGERILSLRTAVHF